MTRYLSLVLIFLAAACFAAEKNSIEELQHKVDSANGGKKAHLLMQLANQQVEQADQLYHDSKTSDAAALVQTSTENSNQATEAALDSGKRLKDTEIELRKLSERLQAIREFVSFEDRKPIDSSIQQIEQNRNKLLDRMFKK